jgi:phage terminase large subunit-like protein
MSDGEQNSLVALLEDEWCNFTNTGYGGAGSPNRADALV